MHIIAVELFLVLLKHSFLLPQGNIWVSSPIGGENDSCSDNLNDLDIISACKTATFSCRGRCGHLDSGYNEHDSLICSCDDLCSLYGDCCWDVASECSASHGFWLGDHFDPADKRYSSTGNDHSTGNHNAFLGNHDNSTGNHEASTGNYDIPTGVQSKRGSFTSLHRPSFGKNYSSNGTHDPSTVNHGPYPGVNSFSLRNETQTENLETVCLRSGYKVISYCPSSWKKDMFNRFEVYQKYEFLRQIPVYDEMSRLHFLNISFFLCHGGDLVKAKLWTTRYEVSKTQSVSQIKDILRGKLDNTIDVTLEPHSASTPRRCSTGRDRKWWYECWKCSRIVRHRINYRRYFSPLCSDEIHIPYIANGDGQWCKPVFEQQSIGATSEQLSIQVTYVMGTKGPVKAVIIQEYEGTSRFRVLECSLGAQVKKGLNCLVTESCPRRMAIHKGVCYEIIYLIITITGADRTQAGSENFFMKAVPNIKVKVMSIRISKDTKNGVITHRYGIYIDSTKVKMNTSIEEGIEQRLASMTVWSIGNNVNITIVYVLDTPGPKRTPSKVFKLVVASLQNRDPSQEEDNQLKFKHVFITIQERNSPSFNHGNKRQQSLMMSLFVFIALRLEFFVFLSRVSQA